MAKAENAVRLQEVLAAIDVREMLANVSVPTLVANAVRDEVIPFSCGEHLASHIPGAKFVPIDSANHILLETEPGWAQFVAALRDFFAGPER